MKWGGDISRSAIFLSVLLAGFVSACDELQESYYDSRAAVVRDGAIQRGWIPDFLPESAANIREFHDLDSNETWLRFSAAPDQPFIARRCRPVNEEKAKALSR